MCDFESQILKKIYYIGDIDIWENDPIYTEDGAHVYLHKYLKNGLAPEKRYCTTMSAVRDKEKLEAFKKLKVGDKIEIISYRGNLVSFRTFESGVEYIDEKFKYLFEEKLCLKKVEKRTKDTI